MLLFLTIAGLALVARIAWILLTPGWVRAVVAGWMPAIPMIGALLLAGAAFLVAYAGDAYKIKPASKWGRRVAWAALGWGLGTWLADGALFVMQMMGVTPAVATK